MLLPSALNLKPTMKEGNLFHVDVVAIETGTRSVNTCAGTSSPPSACYLYSSSCTVGVTDTAVRMCVMKSMGNQILPVFLTDQNMNV